MPGRTVIGGVELVLKRSKNVLAPTEPRARKQAGKLLLKLRLFRRNRGLIRTQAASQVSDGQISSMGAESEWRPNLCQNNLPHTRGLAFPTRQAVALIRRIAQDSKEKFPGRGHACVGVAESVNATRLTGDRSQGFTGMTPFGQHIWTSQS